MAEVKNIYDLTENVRDVWDSVNPNLDTPPPPDALAEYRAIIQAHYRQMAKRLAEGYVVQFDGCGTYTLKHREGKSVTDFNGRRFEMPDYLEVEFNAALKLETIIAGYFAPPPPDVK